MIRRIHAMRGQLSVAYVANYDMTLARLLCAGVDVWLNTPLPPMEASGTSGMKAAMNGVPSLSVWTVGGSRTYRRGDRLVDRREGRNLHLPHRRRLGPAMPRHFTTNSNSRCCSASTRNGTDSSRS